MSRKNLHLNEIAQDIEGYLARKLSIFDVKSKELAVVRAPVDSGYSHFVDVDKLPDREDLPALSERMREFAFRYATEYKTIMKWAQEFGVAFQTVHKWLSNPKVRQHIAYIRYERRMYNMAVWIQLEREALRALHKILDTTIDGYTIDAIKSTAKFILEWMKDPSRISPREKGMINQQIGFFSVGSGKAYEDPYRTELNATDEDIKKLEHKIEDLEMVARELETEDANYEVEEQ